MIKPTRYSATALRIVEIVPEETDEFRQAGVIAYVGDVIVAAYVLTHSRAPRFTLVYPVDADELGRDMRIVKVLHTHLKTLRNRLERLP